MTRDAVRTTKLWYVANWIAAEKSRSSAAKRRGIVSSFSVFEWMGTPEEVSASEVRRTTSEFWRKGEVPQPAEGSAGLAMAAAPSHVLDVGVSKVCRR